MTLFSTLRSLGLTVTVHPMLNPGDRHLNAIDEYRAQETSEDEDEIYWIGEGFRKTILVGGGRYEDMGWKEEEEVCHSSSIAVHPLYMFRLLQFHLQ
jgi:hypothetical protein